MNNQTVTHPWMELLTPGMSMGMDHGHTTAWMELKNMPRERNCARGWIL